jgi:hypothetical protein
VFLPASAPTLKVVRVAGQAVAMEPTGSFVVPDVAIDAAGAVSVELETRNIPLGTVLQLRLQPEGGSGFSASSSPTVAGAEAGSGTASASVSFPAGFTRIFVDASWTP